MTTKPGIVRRLSNDVKFWVGLGTAIFLLYQAAPAVGLQLPRWTWWGEFQNFKTTVNSKFSDVAAAQATASEEQLRTRLAVLRGQLWQVEKEIRDLQRANKPVPESLYRERGRLNDALASIRSKLNPARPFP